MDNKKTALILSAHAADFVWRCGGAIALHSKIGYNVTVVCLSFGERGESAKLWKKAGMNLKKVKDIRKKEAEKAAKFLNVYDIHFFDLGDYPLEVNKKIKFKLVDILRSIQPKFIMSHSKYDPYNTDHMYTTDIAMEVRMIAQAWGHNPNQKVINAPQLYLFEPHQTEQMGWVPDVFLDITEVWDKKRQAIECMQGQQHLWNYYTNLAKNRANHFRRNLGGQGVKSNTQFAEGFQSIFPRCVKEL